MGEISREGACPERLRKTAGERLSRRPSASSSTNFINQQRSAQQRSQERSAQQQQKLEGSFLAVSKPTFAGEHSCYSSFRDLRDLRTSAPLQLRGAHLTWQSGGEVDFKQFERFLSNAGDWPLNERATQTLFYHLDDDGDGVPPPARNGAVLSQNLLLFRSDFTG